MKERIDAIIVMCCLKFNITPDLFFSKVKTRPCASARKAAATILYHCLQITHTEIGQQLNKQTSTVTFMIARSRGSADVEIRMNEILTKYQSIYGR